MCQMFCRIKVNSNTIELTVHTCCYCVLDLLCVNLIIVRSWAFFIEIVILNYPVHRPPFLPRKCSQKLNIWCRILSFWILNLGLTFQMQLPQSWIWIQSLQSFDLDRGDRETAWCADLLKVWNLFWKKEI